MNEKTKNVYITAFNNAISDFLEDIANAYPDIPVFALLRTLHSVAVSNNRKLPMERFGKHVMQAYGEKLRKRDFTFFMNESYEDVPVDNDVVDHIKRLWNTMSDSNKECVKQHLQLLVDIYDIVM